LFFILNHLLGKFLDHLAVREIGRRLYGWSYLFFLLAYINRWPAIPMVFGLDGLVCCGGLLWSIMGGASIGILWGI